jgi:U3 small nucleolar RNA-associated protein 10
MIEMLNEPLGQEAPNLIPSAIRLDVLVELIRGMSCYLSVRMSVVNSMMNGRAVSTNPQTFNQALLLVANLSRLAPDSVLHNVMPVFTFMGSNIFHRDDSYSFRVVQKVSSSLELCGDPTNSPLDNREHRSSHGFFSKKCTR